MTDILLNSEDDNSITIIVSENNNSFRIEAHGQDNGASIEGSGGYVDVDVDYPEDLIHAEGMRF